MFKKITLFLFLTIFVYADEQVLEGKKYGIELGLPRLLTINDEWQSFSGSFSYFDHENQVEYAISWLYSNEKGSNYYIYSDDIRVINVDLHYRKFIREMGALYFSGFARVTNIDGKLSHESGYANVTKLGAGVGIGYRYFSTTSPFYWGAGIIFGRYLLGDNDMFVDTISGISFIDDSPWIVDVELLKFGYAF
jgi:hypothetical protein